MRNAGFLLFFIVILDGTNAQDNELGFHIGTDYSLIRTELQDYPFVINLHGGLNLFEKFFIIGQLTTSRQWLTPGYSYFELGLGGEYILYDDQELFNFKVYSLFYFGVGSYAQYEYDSFSNENIAFGISPSLRVSERAAISLRTQYYTHLNVNSESSGIRIYLGLLYKI